MPLDSFFKEKSFSKKEKAFIGITFSIRRFTIRFEEGELIKGGYFSPLCLQ